MARRRARPRLRGAHASGAGSRQVIVPANPGLPRIGRATRTRVHLKSLTLRGFKSFASSTTLRFEPGITCVVGPNGSGKSNVVDALAWVMGEQGAKTLRGGKMEDVIFAGTGRAAAARPRRGRADDRQHRRRAADRLRRGHDLADDVPQRRLRVRHQRHAVPAARRPGAALRLRHRPRDARHRRAGPARLRAVAGPEERRGFIEEAAGVLKHRKRKEKALRKLDAMQANLTRLQDLTTELRRQLGPLGRQAEVARKAATIQADLRDSRLRLLADDLFELREALEAEVARRDRAARAPRRRRVRSLGGAAARGRARSRDGCGGPAGRTGPGDVVPPRLAARTPPRHRRPGRRARSARATPRTSWKRSAPAAPRVTRTRSTRRRAASASRRLRSPSSSTATTRRSPPRSPLGNPRRRRSKPRSSGCARRRAPRPTAARAWPG